MMKILFFIYTRNLDMEVENLGDDQYNVYYGVIEPGEYTFYLKYGGQPVPGGIFPFTVSKISPNISKTLNLKFFMIYFEYILSSLSKYEKLPSY